MDVLNGIATETAPTGAMSREELEHWNDGMPIVNREKFTGQPASSAECAIAAREKIGSPTVCRVCGCRFDRWSATGPSARTCRSCWKDPGIRSKLMGWRDAGSKKADPVATKPTAQSVAKLVAPPEPRPTVPLDPDSTPSSAPVQCCTVGSAMTRALRLVASEDLAEYLRLSSKLRSLSESPDVREYLSAPQEMRDALSALAWMSSAQLRAIQILIGA